jgi:hypothetical protein
MALHFTDPETVALNRKGILTQKQRNGLLMDLAMTTTLAVVFIVIGAVLPFANGSMLMPAILIGVGIMVLFSSKDTWKLYRDPKPGFTIKRGLVQPVGRIPINKGGTVSIGQDKIYLKREQIREVRFGYNYEFFIVTPYNVPVSADPLDV